MTKQLEFDFLPPVDYSFLLDGIKHAVGNNKRLLQAQYDWLTGKESAYAELWTIAKAVATQLVCIEVKKKQLHFTRSHIEAIATDAVIYVLCRYRKGKGWVARKNYISELKGGVVHVMYYRTDGQKCEKLAVKLMLSGMSQEAALEAAKRKVKEMKEDEKRKRADRVRNN